jgi:hypothetical protein
MLPEQALTIEQSPDHPQALPCAAGELGVRLVDGTLSVSLRDADLRVVLEAIAEEAGIELRLRGLHGGAKVTVAFDSLALGDAFHRLLRGMDYSVVYAGPEFKRRIAKLIVSAHAGPSRVKGDGVGLGVAAPLKDALADYDPHQVVEKLRQAIADLAGEGNDGAVLLGQPSEIATADAELAQALLGGVESKQLIELSEDLNTQIRLSIEEIRPGDCPSKGDGLRQC